ncbi:hypothetical protein SEUCBS139899_002372 [Sporothrix eucalyptigena]|uniref:RING-type domain-containing protein n=1 Tax=Sporothrix eucalyptigena TaxID=1812306 RepID=A0ABP0B1T9_9PEZI
MRHILCGGTKAISHLEEKRKRFPVGLPFRRRPKKDDAPLIGSGAPAAPKSPISGIQLIVAEPAPAPQPVPQVVELAVPQAIPPAEPPVQPPVQPLVEPPAEPLPVEEPAMNAVARVAAIAPPALAAPVPAVLVPVANNVQPLADGEANAAIEIEDDAGKLSYDEEIMTNCLGEVFGMFPDICSDYLQETCESLAYDVEAVISHILDKIDNGFKYPTRPPTEKEMERERKRRKMSKSTEGGAAAAEAVKSTDFIDNNSEMDPKEKASRAIQIFGSDEKGKPYEYITFARTLCQQAYPFVPTKHIQANLAEHKNCLLPALLELDNHIVEKGPMDLAFVFKKHKTKVLPMYSMEELPETIRKENSAVKKEAMKEYLAALKIRLLRKAQREAEKQREIEEAANFRQAQRDGTAKECECCFGDFAMNRMVHCDASLLHWFCRDCARRMAENQIGLSKYTLACMSMDGCKAGFSYDQRGLFLDQKTTVALERIEQEHVLREAGIENLETCPYCPFAAEYPPVEINKEFVCQNPECEAVTCRLCRKDTHIPKTCAEVERENGPSARLTIEEAMSAAMIRNCNKCGTPFIKDHGCNKMTCSRAGCNNVQCYVCHKSCDYSHFDDTTRGGKQGNCPLFESAEERHEEEVQAAEAKARETVVKSNPDLDINLLRIHLSDKVVADEKRRKDEEAERQAANRR